MERYTAGPSVFLDQATPSQAQERALALDARLKAGLARIRDAVLVFAPELETYKDLQYALDALAAARPQHIRCPYKLVESIEDLVRLAHDPTLKRASVIQR